jgi:hypothetical protein
LRGFVRRVIKNSIAVIAGDHFRAAAHVGHDLRSQRHVARSAGAVASFRHRHPVADARGNTLVKRADGFGKFVRQAFAFGDGDRDLLLLCPNLFVESLEPRFHICAQFLDFRRALCQILFRLISDLHLLEDLRLKRRNLFTRGIGFANCSRVLVWLLGGHQISIGSFGSLFLFEDFGFQAGAFVAGIIA